MSPEEIIDQALQRYERPLVSYAKAITGDLESARDAVQETFLRLSRQDVASLESRLAPWLFFVCRNCALDHCRKASRFIDRPVDDDRPSESLSPDAEAELAEDSLLLKRLVDQLPQAQRELVKLKYEAGLSYKEMSETTRMSVSNVGVQLHAAIQTLRRLWNNERVLS